MAEQIERSQPGSTSSRWWVTEAGAGMLLARAWVASRVPFKSRAKKPVLCPGIYGALASA
jgi:hypothetical protein